MIKIEYLYPEIANLYGDPFNIKYLKNCLKEAEVVETSLVDGPKFVSEEIDMIYMGSMSEKSQKLIIEKLMPYKEKLHEMIDAGKVFLLTGNAVEVFEKYIEDNDGNKLEGLGLIDAYAMRNMSRRYNTLFLGKLPETEIKIMGFKSTFSFSFGDNSNCFAFKSIKGVGINKDSTLEGFRIKNLFGTYLIGPLLVINPDFTKYIMKLLGEEKPSLQNEEVANKCFELRLKEFENESTNYLQ